MSKQRRKESGKPAVSQHAATGVVHAVSEDARHAMIAEAAYFIAEQRGFQCDAALDDWLRAESEVNARLAAGINK